MATGDSSGGVSPKGAVWEGSLPDGLYPSQILHLSTACGYFCHSACASQAPPCPVPPELLRTALGVHPETGTGTAYEGFLSVSCG